MHHQRALSFVVPGVVCLLSFFSACSSKPSNPPQTTKIKYYTPAWSPDGTEIAVTIWRDGDSITSGAFMSVIDASSGQVRRERRAVGISPSAMSWTPDGSSILFRSDQGIFKISADLDTLSQLTSGQFHDAPSVSTARDLVFFCVNGGSEAGLWSVSLEGDSLRRWSNNETILFGAQSFPDSSDSLVGLDPTGAFSRIVVLAPDSIADSRWLGINPQVDDIVRISADHRYVAFHNRYSSEPFAGLYLLDRERGTTELVAQPLTEEMSFSPDGKQLLYTRLNGEVGLWIYDIALKHHTCLTCKQLTE